jgi:GntR family transcriptional repressor for pyruvate dehydrogenase complex
VQESVDKQLVALRSVGKRSSVRADIAAEIRHFILSNRLAPGAPLPSEQALAAQLGASRNSVREGLRELVAEGLVRVQHGRGAFVHRLDLGLLVARLSDRLRYEDEIFLELNQFRLPVDVFAAREAALHAQEEHLATMVEAVHRLEAAYETKHLDVQADVAFHNAIYAASGNRVLQQVMTVLSDLLYELRVRHGTVRPLPPELMALHRLILEAIQRRDPDAAAAAMEAHMRLAIQRVQETISERQKGERSTKEEPLS